MINTVVVDASVAAKWFLSDSSEPLQDQARQLLVDYTRGGLHLVVPDLFFVEVANVLWKAIRPGRIAKSAAIDSIIDLSERTIETISSSTLLNLAFAIATTFNRSVYDSIYVALAMETNAEFVTADERLANVLSPHCPVKWLGAM